MPAPTARLSGWLAAAALLTAAAPADAQRWRDALIERRGPHAQPAPPLPAGAHLLRDIAYGGHPRQRYDAYLPAAPRRAPILVLVHGGGWAHGDKDHRGLIPNKATYWVARGYVLVSVNYRPLPDATPLDRRATWRGRWPPCSTGRRSGTPIPRARC